MFGKTKGDKKGIFDELKNNLLGKLGNFLVKKFGVSENTGKELESNLNNENDALNTEISKISN